MPRRHLLPETYAPCPLCGEPLSTKATSCFHCGANERLAVKSIAIVTVVRDYRVDRVEVERHIPPPSQAAVALFQKRRRFRGQNFQVIALVLSIALLLPILGPLVLRLVGG